jgi:hypothetical protein
MVKTSKHAGAEHSGITGAAFHTIEALGELKSSQVSYVEQVVRAGQLHLRTVSRASAFKLDLLGAGQNHLYFTIYKSTNCETQIKNIYDS